MAIAFLSLPAYGQKDALKKANEAFEEDNFREAIVYYNRIDGIEKSGPILFKRGICQYELNHLDLALADFQTAYEYGYKNPSVDLYSGKISHNKGAFAQAATYYKKYLSETPITSGDRHRIRQLIKQCGRAVDLSYYKPIAILERASSQVNTVYDEIGMIASPTQEGRYYYTSNRPNTSLKMDASDHDIYYATQDGLKWSESKRLPFAINKSKEDVLVGFTQQANGLILYRGHDNEGEISVNSGSGDRKSTRSVGLPAKFTLYNSDLYFFDDHLVIFSDRLSDSYGGYDLYYTKLENGKWSKPKNMGADINGPYDELSPFLSADGSELYYSSNRDESIGGHDIFFSSYLYEADRWSSPTNLGIPINSPGDDLHFDLSYDGLTATLSSDRKTAMGGMDIFIARFKVPRGQQTYTSNYIPFADYKIILPEEEEITDNTLEQQLSNEITIEDVAIQDDHQLDTNKIDTPTTTPTPKITTPVATTSAPLVATPISTTPPTILLTWSPLYYNTSKDILGKKNLLQVNQIMSFLKANPDIGVDIVCHSDNQGILEFRLFSSIKLAERVQTYLLDNGIVKRRLSVKSYADNYPLVKLENKGGAIGMADDFNARIEFNFYNSSSQELSIKRSVPEIPFHSYDNRYDIFEAVTDNSVAYKIQIATVSQMYRGMTLDLFNDATVEIDAITGLYLYTIGLYDNYAEALLTKRDVERLGITDARILPYYDGRRLMDDQLVYYVNDYPDLQNLMNYGN